MARDLDSLLKGRRIATALVHKPDVLRRVTPARLVARLRGLEIQHAWRRGKFVIIDLEGGDRLVIQPRFTGTVLVREAGTRDRERYLAVSFHLSDGGTFAYRDIRRLGTVSLLDSDDFSRFDRALGVEPLDESFSISRLSDFLRPSKQAVKKVLMDQRKIAGVGNIYANEALWLAQVDPSRPGFNVREPAVTKLRNAVVTVLREAVEARGTTFRDFRDARGEPGRFARQLAVYGRPGEKCLRCGTRLALTHAIDGRSTVFCFRCQR
jgi:formamidopyrimidine-DNA glycosylase